MPAENVIGTNIARLRAARNVSQKALAEGAHLSRLALARIESGEAMPRKGTLRELAAALGVSTVDLATPARSLRTIRFRARKRMRERALILAEVANWIDDYCFLEGELNDHVDFALERLKGTGAEPKSLAEQARSILGIGNQPIHDICGLLEKCGAKVLRMPRATDAFFGLSVAAGEGGPAIVINTWERISVERWIFSAAHELGHLLLHPNAYDFEEEAEATSEEREADAFASFFLMPQAEFQKEWDDAAGHALYERIIKVKRIFHVSYKTILLRLIENGVVGRDIFRIFQTQHKRRFGRTLKKEDEPQALAQGGFDARRAQEPDRLSNADCMDDRLARLVRRAVEAEAVSLGRGAEILRISLDEMRRRTLEWAA